MQADGAPSKARRARLRRRPQDPAGRPLHRRLLGRREAGRPEGRRSLHALLAGLRRPGEVQGDRAQPDRQRLQASSSRSPASAVSASSRGQGEGRLRHRRRRRPGLPRPAHPHERHEEGRRRRLPRRSRPRRRTTGRSSRTNINAIFTVANSGVGYGKISSRDLSRTWEAGRGDVQQADRLGQDQGHPAGPARH